jgi:recombinational DNA repair protein RecR
MQPTNQKRYYSPQFSALAAVSVRRLAWALGKPMPEAVDHMVRLLPSLVDPSKVCLSCLDRSRCSSCVFCSQAANPATVAVLAPQ